MTKLYEISVKNTKISSNFEMIYFFKTKKVKEIFIFVPCFNYKKEAIKYFANCFNNKDVMFVSFPFEPFHNKLHTLSDNEISKYLLKIVKWCWKNYPDSRIYLLSESWAAGPAITFFKKHHYYIEKLIMWNFPNGTTYEKILKWHKPKNKMEVRVFEKKYIFINGYWYEREILKLSTEKYVEKLLTFNLLTVKKFHQQYLKKSALLFEKTWNELINITPPNKIHIIESLDNYIHADKVKYFYDHWKDNISFIKGHHFMLMNVFENKNLFEELERIVYGESK